jgi:acetoin utilization protein AcuC
MRAALFLAPQLGELSYGPAHPFQLDRAADALRLCRALELLGSDADLVQASEASREEIERYHSPDYLDALESAETLSYADLARWGVGPGDNPVFPGLWTSCRAIAGGSLEAARWLLEGIAAGDVRRAFHPGGGLHHARKDRASGFCYVNDPVLAIQEVLAAGYRTCYIDVDAHHGDGVEEAFYEEPNVLTISIHQDGRTIFPGTGFPNEIGRGAGEGYAVNVPVLPGAAEPEYDYFRREILTPIWEAYRPDVLVTEIGVDSLRDDPLTVLNWTLAGLDRFLVWASEKQTPWLAVGGGGYRRWNAIRGWALVWAQMLDTSLPERRPEKGPDGPLPESWPFALWDEPPERAVTSAEVRRSSLEEVASVLKQRVLPRLAG